MTQHQLFAAVVALWFGALFGLGSLAVRPSLVEDLVIRSRIDLLIPAAAPPLGMTARMLIALVMAALGALIGSWIAQRLARPRQGARERKRTTLSTRDDGDDKRAYNAYDDVSTHNPGPAQDPPAAPGVLASRRRSLAIEPKLGEFVSHDMAPLPGGAAQIFDIAAAGLNDAPQAPVAAPEPGSYFAANPTRPPAPVGLDWTNTAPVLAPAEQGAAVPQADDRQVFGIAPPATPPADRPRQIFGAPLADDVVPREFVQAQEFCGSVFDAPESSPLFAARAGAVPVEPALPNPAALGIAHLSARLAESMRRRRIGRTAAAIASSPIPAALRPLDLNGFEEVAKAGQDDLLPPRRITFPAEPAPQGNVPLPVAAAANEPEACDEAADVEENYASLLGVTPSPVSLRNPFVRVKEPEAEVNAVEPVVIFPGQVMPAPQPFAAHVAVAGDEVTPFRRFDAPSATGQGQRSAANATANAMPSEETERALRSALANLQRISGAA